MLKGLVEFKEFLKREPCYYIKEITLDINLLDWRRRRLLLSPLASLLVKSLRVAKNFTIIIYRDTPYRYRYRDEYKLAIILLVIVKAL